MFQRSTVQVVNNQFSIFVPVGSMYTVTTMTTGQKGGFDEIPLSSPSFPLSYSDDFQSTPESHNARRAATTFRCKRDPKKGWV